MPSFSMTRFALVMSLLLKRGGQVAASHKEVHADREQARIRGRRRVNETLERAAGRCRVGESAVGRGDRNVPSDQLPPADYDRGYVRMEVVLHEETHQRAAGRRPVRN